MQTISKFFLATLLLGLFAGCQEEPFIPEPIDEAGPEVYEIRWFDSPYFENDPIGPIENGGVYNVGVNSQYHIRMHIREESEIAGGEIYFEVNGQPELRHYHVRPGGLAGWTEGSVGIVYEMGKLDLGAGEFYDYRIGDRLEFFLSITDVAGNNTELNWTLEVTE